jgi:hypothetical protein
MRRRRLVPAMAVCGVLSVGAASIASAASITIIAGNLVLKFGGSTSPKKLPKREFAPVALYVNGKISSKDGSHPPALREAVVDIDKNGAINAKGAPVCKGGQLEARPTAAAKKVCRRAIVGNGQANIEIAFPEQPPIKVFSPLTIFNGGVKGGKTTMYVHAFITVPVPAAVVTTLTIKKIRKGRYGLNTVAKVPVVAGGSGSALDFRFRIKRSFTYKGRKQSYLNARCPDGRFQTNILKALFKNEAQTPGAPAAAVLKGKLVVPCAPKG